MIKKSNTIIAIAILSITVSACKLDVNINNAEAIDGDGKVTTETRTTGDTFENIEAANGLEVIIEKSDKNTIIVEADSNLQKHIITQVKNGTLYIETDTNIDDYTSKKVYITYTILNKLITTSGSVVSSKKIVSQKDLNIDTSSGSNVKLNIDTQNINCEASSGSMITLEGKTISLETNSSSGSTINAKALTSNKVTSTSSSGSQTSVFPIQFLNANASSGSTINYFNTPKIIEKDESSGASILKY